VAELEAAVPQEEHKLADRLRRGGAAPDEKNVDVRVGTELATAVTPDGEERGVLRFALEVLVEKPGEKRIEARGHPRDHMERVIAPAVALLGEAANRGDLRLRRLDLGREHDGALLEGSVPSRKRRDAGAEPGSARKAHAAHLSWRQGLGGGRTHGGSRRMGSRMRIGLTCQ
jgi:hypothetical protein